MRERRNLENGRDGGNTHTRLGMYVPVPSSTVGASFAGWGAKLVLGCPSVGVAAPLPSVSGSRCQSTHRSEMGCSHEQDVKQLNN